MFKILTSHYIGNQDMDSNKMDSFTDLFQLDPDLIHVNHAAVAPWPKKTAETVCQFANENSFQGSLNYPQWLEKETMLRQQFKQLINADSTDEIALLKSTSEALSVVAYGIDWQAGDSVVTAAEEFPSNRILWQSLSQFGVDVRIVDYTNNLDITPEEALLNACDKTTRLLSVSAVQYASGRKMQLEQIGLHCKKHNILFCVDAIQQLGALSFDVNKIHADFVAADGHKWMLGPEGLALFYCRKKHIASLKLNQYGWHMLEHHHDFNRTDWEPAHTARRFECGSPNMTAVMALSSSLDLLLTTGIERVEKEIIRKTDYLINALSGSGKTEIISPTSNDQRSGIVTFSLLSKNSDDLFEHLNNQRIFCALRGGGIRLSPHFYTEDNKLEKVISTIESFVR